MNKTPLTARLRARVLPALFAAALAPGLAHAVVIAYDFSENPNNQVLDNTTPKGPLGTAIWNDSNERTSGTLAEGTETNLVNSLGVTTSVSVSWTSSNVYYNASGTGSEEAKLVVGYLDDHQGVNIVFTDIPFARYNVYGIVGSDTGSTYTTLDFLINDSIWALGGSEPATATAFGHWGEESANGTWTQIVPGSVTGNYWKVSDVTGSTLTIAGQLPANGARGGLSSIIIEEVPVPEPSAALLGGFAALATLFRRRR